MIAQLSAPTASCAVCSFNDNNIFKFGGLSEDQS